jgi:type I restriction enzyme M protein
MVNLLFVEDDDVLSKPGVVRTVYDPAAGTGGMLSVADDYLAALNPQARLTMFGQELNDESYALCKADIVAGNTFSEDGHPNRKFDYMLSNPPFGVEWKKVEREVRKEHENEGFNGRFGPGLPRISDGSLLEDQIEKLATHIAPTLGSSVRRRKSHCLKGRRESI